MPRVKTERWDPIGKARGERRSPRIRSDVSDPQRVVAILGDVPGVGISGIQPPRPFLRESPDRSVIRQTPFRPRNEHVSNDLVPLNEVIWAWHGLHDSKADLSRSLAGPGQEW